MQIQSPLQPIPQDNSAKPPGVEGLVWCLRVWSNVWACLGAGTWHTRRHPGAGCCGSPQEARRSSEEDPPRIEDEVPQSADRAELAPLSPSLVSPRDPAPTLSPAT